MKKKILLLTLIFTMMNFTLFAREVDFTKELNSFVDAVYLEQITSNQQLNDMFQKSMDSVSQFNDEYSKNVHFARCYFFYGVKLLGSFDASQFADVDVNAKDNGEAANQNAADYFDKGIAFAEKALKVREGSDAYTILGHCISLNCTAKNASYAVANGLKIKTYAKKAMELDRTNGTAYFLLYAQDIYAPKPFCQISKGMEAYKTALSDSTIHFEKYDILNMNSGIGYGNERLKNYSEAAKYYSKALVPYPTNAGIKKLLDDVKQKM